MLTLIQLIGSDIGIPISFAYSNDFRATIDAIIATKSIETQKLISILTYKNLRIDTDGQVRPDASSAEIIAVLAEVVQGRADDHFVVIFASKVKGLRYKV